MNLICPECKNNVDLSAYADLAVKQVIECDVCGITLEVTDIKDGNVWADIVDEGK